MQYAKRNAFDPAFSRREHSPVNRAAVADRTFSLRQLLA